MSQAVVWVEEENIPGRRKEEVDQQKEAPRSRKEKILKRKERPTTSNMAEMFSKIRLKQYSLDLETWKPPWTG